MNWVGGSRNRYMMKNDTKKQREFFEKRKMKQRLQNLGVPMTTSQEGSSSCSMDLVTLFIVNQIAAKKEIKEPPKVTVLGGRGPSKAMRSRPSPLDLPMSPGSPSRLSLKESQPHYSVQEQNKISYCIPENFKCQQLSPVLESAFSDHSCSDQAQPISPFSIPSACSAFPVQPDLQQRDRLHPISPAPPWDTSTLQAQLRPFSQPRGMGDWTPWYSGSDMPHYPPDRPAVARVLFGSPPSCTEASDQGRHGVSFSLNQSEDRQLLDFTLSQSETPEQFDEGRFSGFSNEGCGSEGSCFVRSQSKMNLKEDTTGNISRKQRIREPQTCGPKSKPRIQEEDGCQLYLLAGSSNVPQTVSTETLNCEAEQPALMKAVDTDCCSDSHPQREGSKAQVVCSHSPIHQRPIPETRDVEIQTCDTSKRETSDAYTQCSPQSEATVISERSQECVDGAREGRRRALTQTAPGVTERTGEPLKEVRPSGGENRLTEEVRTLQEMADILLMLKQRKKGGGVEM